MTTLIIDSSINNYFSKENAKEFSTSPEIIECLISIFPDRCFLVFCAPTPSEVRRVYDWLIDNYGGIRCHKLVWCGHYNWRKIITLDIRYFYFSNSDHIKLIK